MKNDNTATATIAEKTNDALASLKTTKIKNGLDLIIRLDRPAALAALRSIAGSLQFSMISAADWILRENENQQRLAEFGLNERNEQDEATRFDQTLRGGVKSGQTDLDTTDAGGHPMGFELQQTPTERLQQAVLLYDAVIYAMRDLTPTAFDLPRSLTDSIDQFIVSQGNFVPAAESTLTALHAAGVTDQEFADAGYAAGAKRQARTRERKPAILQLINDQGGDANLDVFTQLPVHVQLRMMANAWKGVFARRRQLVTYIAARGKLEQLSDAVLLKNGLKDIEAWCDDFEKDNSILIEALIDSGVNVTGIGDAIAWSKAPRK